MNFEFGGTGAWAQVFKPVNMDLSKLDTVSFEYKYSGQQNNLEFKLTDDKNTNFGYKLDLEPSSRWQTQEIGAKDLQYFWGNSTVLNFRNIKQVWFAPGKDLRRKRNSQFEESAIHR